MEADGVDVLMLSVGSDLPYFCGYEAMPLERITMLVVPRRATPRCHPGPRARPCPRAARDLLVAPWGETEDPIAKIADLAGAADRSPSVTTCGRAFSSISPTRCPTPRFAGHRPSEPIRQVKDAEEIARLREAGAPSIGSPPGCSVARSRSSGRPRRRSRPNSDARFSRRAMTVVSPSSPPGRTPPVRIITPVSASSRLGTGALRFRRHDDRRRWHRLLLRHHSQHLDRRSPRPRIPRACGPPEAQALRCAPPRWARRVRTSIVPPGGASSMRVSVRRWCTGRPWHGVEAHEDPYIVEGNTQPLAHGNAFSVEPGIYIEGSGDASGGHRRRRDNGPTHSIAPTTTSPFSDESTSGALAASRPQRRRHGNRPGCSRSTPRRCRWSGRVRHRRHRPRARRVGGRRARPTERRDAGICSPRHCSACSSLPPPARSSCDRTRRRHRAPAVGGRRLAVSLGHASARSASATAGCSG